MQNLIVDGPMWLMVASLVLAVVTELLKRGAIEPLRRWMKSDWYPRVAAGAVAVTTALVAPDLFPADGSVGRLLLAVAATVGSWGAWEMAERRDLVEGRGLRGSQ